MDLHKYPLFRYRKSTIFRFISSFETKLISKIRRCTADVIEDNESIMNSTTH